MDLLEVSSNGPDFDEMVKLDHNYFERPWDNKAWQMFLENPYYKSYVLKEGGEVVGLSCYFVTPGENSGYLLKIIVHPNFRKKGLGELLLRPASIFDSCFLEVDTKNSVAVAFYEKHGFQKKEKISQFYSDGSDAFRMIKYF